MLWEDSGCDIPPTMIHSTTSNEVEMDVDNPLNLVVVFALPLLLLPPPSFPIKRRDAAVVVPARVAPADLDCWSSVDKSDTTTVFAVITAATHVVFAAAVLLVSFFRPQMTPSKNDMLLLLKNSDATTTTKATTPKVAVVVGLLSVWQTVN